MITHFDVIIFVPVCVYWSLMFRISEEAKTDYNCTESHEVNNTYYYGDLIGIKEDVSSMEECTSLCDQTENCVSTNYHFINHKCEFMNNVNDVERDPESFVQMDSSIFTTVKCSAGAENQTSERIKRQLLTGSCGHATVSARKSTARIVGGFESKPNSFPWVVGLYQRNQQFCGGTLLYVGDNQKSDIVVTAAHCVYGLTARYLSVKMGCSDLTQRSCIPMVADKIEVHPQFNMILATHDIALIKLQIPVNFNANTQPICLPWPKDTLTQPGTVCTVAGWGSLYENGPGSKHLMQVDVPIMDINTCNSKSFYDGQLEEDVMLCAGYPEGKKDSCQGDSGGPLMAKRDGGYVLVGVVSFGQGCARQNYPGIYTKVDYFRSWVDQKIQSISSLSATKNKGL